MTTFGLHLTSYPAPDPGNSIAAYTRDVAAAVEGSGVFSALWLTDHVHNLGPGGPTAPMPESHLVLAAIAASTQELDLGLLATSVVYRNPALLAKMITTLDVLSGGRAILGIGAGHPRTQAEAESYGYQFPPIGTRMDMLDHALAVIRSMTGPEPAGGAPPNWPRPLRAGGIPVLVAGSGEQRLLRIAAKHADMINLSLPSGDSLARMAELVRREGYVHHFNSRPLGITSARAFLSNTCAQLIVRYRLDYTSLPAGATEDGGFLLRLLDEASERQARDDPPVVLAVDALDEADDVGLPTGANRLFLPPVLPEGVFIVVTTRPQYDYRLYVENRRDHYIGENDAENLEDVRAYITAFVTRNATRMASQIRAWAATDEQFIDVLVTKSEGNFMYLVHVLRDIHDGSGAVRSIDSLNQLPQGLGAYYQRHWNAMRSADPTSFERYEEPVVCLLATAKEPVTIDLVLSWTREHWRRRGWDPGDVTASAVSEVIKRWWEFLDRDDVDGQQRFRVYHASFQDFLRDEVGFTTYDDTIADTALAKIPGFHDGTAGTS
jgi:hypothetical protein